jgi:hypothetical protein
MTDIYRVWFRSYHCSSRGLMNDWEELWYRLGCWWTGFILDRGWPNKLLADCSRWEKYRRRLAFPRLPRWFTRFRSASYWDYESRV